MIDDTDSPTFNSTALRIFNKDIQKLIKMVEWEVDSCVRSYHVYENIWAAALGERIGCVREPFNTKFGKPSFKFKVVKQRVHF